MTYDSFIDYDLFIHLGYFEQKKKKKKTYCIQRS